MPRPRLETDPLHVITVKPDQESNDWTALAKTQRRWNAKGVVINRSDSHGLCYEVEHAPGDTAWYEPRELQQLETSVWNLL